MGHALEGGVGWDPGPEAGKGMDGTELGRRPHKEE